MNEAGPAPILGSMRPDGSRLKVHPADVRGRWLTRRRAVFAVLIAIYVLAPLVPVGGHPSIMLDVQHRRFYLVGQTFNAQDFWMVVLIARAFVFGLDALEPDQLFVLARTDQAHALGVAAKGRDFRGAGAHQQPAYIRTKTLLLHFAPCRSVSFVLICLKLIQHGEQSSALKSLTPGKSISKDMAISAASLQRHCQQFR